MNFCSNCGQPLTYDTPPGDDRARYCCDTCGVIHYQNPRMVVGCIPEMQDRILLCRRAIEPCYGKWTLPAGYLENGETVAAGAGRETYEEARLSEQQIGERVKYLKDGMEVNVLTWNNQVGFMANGLKFPSTSPVYCHHSTRFPKRQDIDHKTLLVVTNAAVQS